MDRLAALRVLVAVADKNSFSEAARFVRSSPTVVSRVVSAMEHELGVALFYRTTRSVTPTAEGHVYVERCRRALNELEEGRLLLRGERAEPRGMLVITAPVVFGQRHVQPIVSRLLRAHTELKVRLTLSDQILHLAEEGVDIAVRIGNLTDSALHAVRVAAVRRVLVASPDYIAKRGVPREPAQLRRHDLIDFGGFAAGSEWRFGHDGRPSIRFEPRLLTNSVEAAIDAALEGVGIARPLTYQVDKLVRDGRLVFLLTDFTPATLPISLVCQENRRKSPNVRAFIEAARIYVRDCPIEDLSTLKHFQAH